TSLLFSLRDKPGTLTEILNILADNNINMKKIQSRPSKILACEYTFFIDLEGHIKEPQVKASLEQIEERTTFFKILGSYQTC
ncbi:MAG TPA: ACT domain-containing protein, partial [Spirochaetota bacterium]|nr:ACT domain-containing protein [Spirochaetota bacterium]